MKLQHVASNRKIKKLGATFMALMISCIALVPFASAAEATSEPTFQEAASTIYDSVHAVINFNNILAIIGVAITGAATIYLLWWAIRKIIKMVKGALNGKLKV